MRKYYTPDFTELHVGLECEIHPPTFGEQDGNWIRKTISTGSNFVELMGAAASGFLRVKILDLQDCIDCGWKERFDEGEFEIDGADGHYYQMSFDRYHSPDGIAVGLSIHRSIGGSIDEMKVFVRNKGELKFLMQRHGII